jgi:phosphoglycolate phosphatase-like HAD superfamily hydrolase
VKLEPFDLNRYFTAGGFGSDSEDRPTIASVARRQFEVLCGHPIEARDVLVIGDTEHDVACGRVNGFRTLAVGTGGVPLGTLRESGADLVYEDLSDVDGVLAAIREVLGNAPRASA